MFPKTRLCWADANKKVRRARWLRAIVAVKILPTIKSSEMAAFVKEMSYVLILHKTSLVKLTRTKGTRVDCAIPT